MRIVCDIETDGIDATKIHCACYYNIDTGESESLITYESMIELFSKENLTVIGHNFIRYDAPTIERILDIKMKAVLIDTLGLSWYLYPERTTHGLESWGTDLGVEKPKVDDWENADISVYIHRCSEDVKINTKLWDYQFEYLEALYGHGNTDRIIGYLMYKLECAREQEELRWKLDIDRTKENLAKLSEEREGKADLLSEIMPPHITYKNYPKPKIPYKKDGSLSVNGEKWFRTLREKGLPDYHQGTLKLVDKELKGNPRSHQQLKEWLFSLGWKPITFKYVKEAKDPSDPTYTPMNSTTTRAVPQLSTDDGICESVKQLYAIEPNLVHLENFFILSHRISILEGFLENVSPDGYLKAQIKGFTNTLRFQHTTIVNLPTIYKEYGPVIRECLVAPEGYTLCGSDMSSLESNTRNHYIHFFDPVYVEEMSIPGFDSHTDIAVLAGAMTKEEEEFFKWYTNKKV